MRNGEERSRSSWSGFTLGWIVDDPHRFDRHESFSAVGGPREA
jgi:hypothetical protein